MSTHNSSLNQSNAHLQFKNSMKLNLFNNNDLECILEQDKVNKKSKKIKIVKKST